jgi:hypothetical protein
MRSSGERGSGGDEKNHRDSDKDPRCGNGLDDLTWTPPHAASTSRWNAVETTSGLPRTVSVQAGPCPERRRGLDPLLVEDNPAQSLEIDSV